MTDHHNRILVIGNSHVAALRNAWADDEHRWDAWDFAFFGLPGSDLSKLHMTDGVLGTKNRQIRARMRRYSQLKALDTTGYDAFVIVGGYSLIATAGFSMAHRASDFPSVRAAGGDDTNDYLLVGKGLFEGGLDARLISTAAGHILRQLAPMGRPILIVPEPLPAPDCGDDAEKFGAYADLIRRGDQPIWAALFQAAARRCFGDRAQLLGWPGEAVQDGAFTRADLMRGSMRLDLAEMVPHPVNEYAHANAAYGAIVMDQIAAALPDMLAQAADPS